MNADQSKNQDMHSGSHDAFDYALFRFAIIRVDPRLNDLGMLESTQI